MTDAIKLTVPPTEFPPEGIAVPERLGIIAATLTRISKEDLGPHALQNLYVSMYAVTGHSGNFSAAEMQMHYGFLSKFVDLGVVR